jgi:hypothetical protein
MLKKAFRLQTVRNLVKEEIYTMAKAKVKCYCTKCSHNPSGVDLLNNIQRGYRLVKVETHNVHQQKET